MGTTAAFLVCVPVCVLGAVRPELEGVELAIRPLTGQFSVYICVCLWAEEDLTWTAAAPEARYTDIILYVSGSLALVVLLLLAGLYRGQVLISQHPRQPATVQKLSRFPLARQVPCCSPPLMVSP